MRQNGPFPLAGAAQPAGGALSGGDAARRIGCLAVRGLYREVALNHKPGLVTPESCGSHRDMDFHTFMRSLHALRSYFPAIAALGLESPEFPALQGLGVAAERRMLQATAGVNTHRGAIFNLGLLCAAAGLLTASGELPRPASMCAVVRERWGEGILASAASPLADDGSHGLQVARRYGAGGARQEAAAGFPSVRDIGLPAYRAALLATGDPALAATQALFSLIAEVEDSNLLYRGGPPGLAFGQRLARGFLAAGGVLADDWSGRAAAIDREFVARRLSPGGSADLLGVTLFLAEAGVLR